MRIKRHFAFRRPMVLAARALVACQLVAITAAQADAAIQLTPLWSHAGGGPAAAEIVCYDEAARQFLVGNGAERCITRLDARTGQERGRFDVSKFGDPTSVAASHGLVAVAVVAPVKTDPGNVVFFRSGNSDPVAVVRVGALPDMVTFTPDGRHVLAVIEGEPSDDYAIDPEGSVAIIDVSQGPEKAVALAADFRRFNGQRDELEREGVRVAAPNANASDGRATFSQDAEPEYIAASPDGRTAYVTLQENNALAIVDVNTATAKKIVGLGYKDHSAPGNGLDASAVDGPNGRGGIHIRRWPVWGMYMPDAIAAFDAEGDTFVVTANEGDGRGYTGFSDSALVKDLKLDASLGDADELQADDALGQLKVSSVGGDTDGDGDVDRLLAFGGRSVAVWTADGKLVYDSGDTLEQFIATQLPERFNINSEAGDNSEGGDVFDSRSPEKGPEPEGLVVGRVGDSTFAFVGLERTSAVAVFDISQPRETKLVGVAPLPLTKDANSPFGGPHIAPEGLCFVSAERSPLGAPLLAVSCEVTGTTILFRVDSVAAQGSAVKWKRNAAEPQHARRRRYWKQPRQARPF